MKVYNLILFVSGMLSIGLFACKNQEANESEHHHEEAEELPQKHDDDEIVLEPDIAERFGVRCDTVSLRPFMPARRATGEILGTPADEAVISASTTGILTWTSGVTPGTRLAAGQSVGKIQARTTTGDDPNKTSRAAIAAAKRELDRLRPLLDDGIATMSEYNTALAAYEAAKASFSGASASGIVRSPKSGVVTDVMASTGQFVDTGTPLARIAQNRSLILRADLPESEMVSTSAISDVKIRLAGSDEWLTLPKAGLKQLESADMPMKAGYRPVYFSFNNDGRFSVGSRVEVEFSDGSRKQCVALPEAALIEQQGEYYVYVRKGNHSYEKRLVKTGDRSGDFVEILSGVAPGDMAVVEGAHAVRMAESSGAVPEGHTHNH